MNFLITSTGRTATKWLAHLMNKSKVWTVFHEPRGYRNDSYKIAMFIFKNQYYGEVNGALRNDFEKFPFKKAIISRCYKEHLLSLSNRYDYNTFIQKIVTSKQANEMFHKFETPVVFDYHKMTTDLEYLKRIFKWCGINDYTPTNKDLITKVNEGKQVNYKSYHLLPKEVKFLIASLNFINLKPNF
jgi:arsenate reductase-like glutaredoxin family protein